MFLIQFITLFVFYVLNVPKEHYEIATLPLYWLSTTRNFNYKALLWLYISDPTAPPTGNKIVLHLTIETPATYTEHSLLKVP